MSRTKTYRRLEAIGRILARIQRYAKQGMINESDAVTIGGFPISSQGMLKKILTEHVGDEERLNRFVTEEVKRLSTVTMSHEEFEKNRASK